LDSEVSIERTNNREPMIWRRQGEEEEEEGEVVSPLFFSSLLQAPPFASPTTVIANFSNYYKLCKTLDKFVINMALVFCNQSSVFLGVLKLIFL
jgi:hypothetical protein